MNETIKLDTAEKGLAEYAGNYMIRGSVQKRYFVINPDGSVQDLIQGVKIEASDIRREQTSLTFKIDYINADGKNIKGEIKLKEPFWYKREMSADICELSGKVSNNLINKGSISPKPTEGTGFEQTDADKYAGIWIVADTDLKDSIFTIDAKNKNMEHAYVKDNGRNGTIYSLDVTNITKVNSSYKLDYYNWAIYDTKCPYKEYSQCRMDTTLTFNDNNNAAMSGSVIDEAGNIEKINMKLMRKQEFPAEFKTTWTLTHTDGAGGGTRTLIIKEDLSIEHTYKTKDGKTTTVKIPKEGVVEKFTGDPNKFTLEAGNGNNYPIPTDGSNPDYGDGKHTIEFILNIDKTKPNEVYFYYKILAAIPDEQSHETERTYTK